MSDRLKRISLGGSFVLGLMGLTFLFTACGGNLATLQEGSTGTTGSQVEFGVNLPGGTNVNVAAFADRLSGGAPQQAKPKANLTTTTQQTQTTTTVVPVTTTETTEVTSPFTTTGTIFTTITTFTSFPVTETITTNSTVEISTFESTSSFEETFSQSQFSAVENSTFPETFTTTEPSTQTNTVVSTETSVITPTATATIAGGIGATYGNASGGSLQANGDYTTGANAHDVIDTLTFTGANNNSVVVKVAVNPTLIVTPAGAQVSAGGTSAINVAGGNGTNTFTFLSNESGATLNGNTYTAGSVSPAVDVVEVQDTAGHLGLATFLVGSPLTVQAATATPQPFTIDQISATGGVGTLTFSFLTNQSGGNIDAVSGQYQAGPNGGTDVIVVVDSKGNVGLLSISPSLGQI